MNNKSPVVLCLIEGISLSASWRGNALLSAKNKNFINLWTNYPHTIINSNAKDETASFLSLGMGQNQLSNEEFILEQITSKNLIDNKGLNLIFNNTIKNDSGLHFFITINHDLNNEASISLLNSYLRLAKNNGIFNLFIHIVISGQKTNDSRDVLLVINRLEKILISIGVGEIATIIGENYISNFSSQSDLINAYRLYILGKGNKTVSAEQAIASRNKIGKSLSEMSPFCLTRQGEPIAKINNFDSVVFCNIDNNNISKFISSLAQKNLRSDQIEIPKYLNIASCFELLDHESSKIIYFYDRMPTDTFASIISKNNLSQHYVSENTRTYQIKKHLKIDGLKNTTSTFIERPEDLITYISGYQEILNKYLQNIKRELEKNYLDFILIDIPILCFINEDNSFKNTIAKISEIDIFLGELKKLVFNKNGALIITSINSRSMAKTKNTSQSFPFIFALNGITKDKVINSSYFQNELMMDLLRNKCDIIDLAPTILDLFKIKKPLSMNGKNLLDSKIMR